VILRCAGALGWSNVLEVTILSVRSPSWPGHTVTSEVRKGVVELLAPGVVDVRVDGGAFVVEDLVRELSSSSRSRT
jgi:hypothetical protein